MRLKNSTTLAFLRPKIVLIVAVLAFSALTPSIYAQSSTLKANQLLEKSLALMDEAKFKHANQALKKAAGLFIQTENPVMAAHCYNHLSSNSRLMNHLAVSRRQAQKALSLLEGTEPEAPTESVRAYTNLGLLAAIQASYEKSLALLKKASALIDHSAVSPVLKMVVISSLGYLYDDLGRYNKALYYYNRGLDILLAQPDPPKFRLAKLYNNIGVAYSNKGLYRQARHYYRLELKMNLTAKGVNHPDVAGTYLNIGNSYYRSGDVGEAIIYFERALRVIEKSYGRNHSMMVLALNHMAKCEMKLGNFEKAIGYLTEAIEIKEQLVGVHHPELAINYSTLAAAYAKTDDREKSLYYYQKALTVQKKSLRKNHPDIAPTYNALAKFLLDNGQAERALAYLKKARHILLASVGSRHPTLAETYAATGQAYAQQGKVVQSISYFQNALAITAPAFNGVKAKKNPNPMKVVYPAKAISVLVTKAEALCLLHKKTDEPSLLKAALYTYYALSRLLDKQQWGYNQLNSKLAIARRSYKIYEQAINAAYEMYEITGSRSYFHLIFYFSEKSKGRVLLEAVAHTNDKQLAGIPAEVLKREQQLKYALTQVKQALYGVNSRAEKKYQSARLKDSLFVLNRKIAAFTKKLESSYPRYYRLKYNSEFPEIFAIQKNLEAANAAIVEYFYGSNSLYAVVITPTKVWVEPLGVNQALATEINRFRSAILSASGNYFKWGYRLYRKLIEPIQPVIKSFSSLLIVPGGPLRLLPFGALLKKKVATPGHTAFSALPYLINDYNISYSTSLALNAAMAVNSNHKYNLQFIGFAPVFAAETTRGMKSVVSRSSMNWKPLSFTDYEVMTIASRFKKEDSFWSFLPWKDTQNFSLFIGAEATESNFKSKGSLNGRYIHLATHAFAAEQVNGQTGIVFYQNGIGKNDDILYTNEIYDLQLHTELVVLSACETGIGNIIPGEGLMGLTRAFQYAGANNLIVSLWKVGDRSTAELMVSFYSNLQSGYSMSRALSAAKRAIISNRRYAHPRYWATFKLIGNGEEVNSKFEL